MRAQIPYQRVLQGTKEVAQHYYIEMSSLSPAKMRPSGMQPEEQAGARKDVPLLEKDKVEEC